MIIMSIMIDNHHDHHDHHDHHIHDYYDHNHKELIGDGEETVF